MDRGEIRLVNETIAKFDNYMVSRGVPLPPGRVHDVGQVRVVDAKGQPVPSEASVLQRRPDGSVEWALVDLLSSWAPEEKKSLFVEIGPNTHAPVEHPVVVSENDEVVVVSNGITGVSISKRGGSLFRGLFMHNKPIVGPTDKVDLEVVNLDGKVFRASVGKSFNVTIEHANRLRAVVKIEGKHVARDGSTFLDFALRVTLTANRADLGLQHTFFCREPVNGVVEVKAMRFVMPTRMSPAATKLVRQAHHGHTFFPRTVEVPENVEIAASSVNDVNQYAKDYKYAKMGTLFLRNYSSLREGGAFYPFHMKPQGGSEFRADYMIGGVRQIYPWLAWKQEDLTLVFSMRYWKQLHPKSVTIDENVMTVSIWPDWSVPMKLVPGVSKSHRFFLTGEPRAMNHDECEAHALQWEVQGVEPLDISFDPAWPAYCEVLDCHRLLRYQPRKYTALEHRITATGGEPSRFTYPRNNPIGMFHFGDSGGEGGWSNNEDDSGVFVPLRDYLRTGESFHFDHGHEKGEHYMEVDFCEWSTDPRQNGGLIPHTVDHFIGNVYPSHMWSEGILAYFYITGDPRARNVVVRVGDNNIHWATNVMEAVACDGREAGIPLVNLAAAYRLTRDEKYITAARLIINAFHKKWYDQWGDLKYPYPQGGHLKWTTGYGDYSSYYGLFRIWEVTGAEDVRQLLIALLKPAVQPERFSVNDGRMMDYFAVWAYVHLTGDKSVFTTLKDQIANFLEKGGHPMRRLEFLNLLDREGLLKDK
ncbi:MAG: hypothetical protein K8S99_08680 [Planctomycetes bacterium]|nr:hypothetical protein [Planctomycetota bacterium]